MPFRKGYASKKSAGEARKAGKPKRKDEERRKAGSANTHRYFVRQLYLDCLRVIV